ALAVLERVPAALRREGCAYVLPGKEGDSAYGGLAKGISRIMGRRAALDRGAAPVLRDTFASFADELGYTEGTVAALLGQRSGSVTRRYIHQLDRALIAAADRVSSHISTAMGAEDRADENIIPLRAIGG